MRFWHGLSSEGHKSAGFWLTSGRVQREGEELP